MQNINRIEIVNPAPILNTPNFSYVFGGESGNQIPLNSRGHPFYYEFVALKGMVFEIVNQCSSFIFHVKHAKYPNQNLFVDSRFFCTATHESNTTLPDKEVVLKKMANRLGTPYVWGGNWCEGIPEMLQLYPPQKPIDQKTEILWTWKGLDCSGLLYEATEGASPRNTSELVYFGKSLNVSHLCIDSLIDLLQPLDMIVYPGHVLFVYDSHTTIESKSPYGVIYRNLKERLQELLRDRKLVDEWTLSLNPESHFLIRRIY